MYKCRICGAKVREKKKKYCSDRCYLLYLIERNEKESTHFDKNQKRMISDSDILRKVVDEINEIARTINSN